MLLINMCVFSNITNTLKSFKVKRDTAFAEAIEHTCTK